ncbi:hypothetical protein EBZ37_11380 [bacterium]|nr:hypothetical protein [bacterium]
MSKNQKPKNWIPEIVYEEGESQIPFIHVPPGQDDPKLLFIFVAHQTGEVEPGSEGEEVPVIDMDLKQFVDLSLLKMGLTEQEYDKVRAILGLEPLRQATEKGKKITSAVREKISSDT